MENPPVHEIELYPPETFKILLDHEVNMSRRYGDPLTLIHLAVEPDPSNPETRHSAEVFVINALNLQVRNTDIPCKKDNEFLVLIPSTDEQGGRMICRRLEELFNIEHHTYDRVSFQLSAFIGMASLPGDSSISSGTLMQNAAAALEYARQNRLKTSVIFSELNH